MTKQRSQPEVDVSGLVCLFTTYLSPANVGRPSRKGSLETARALGAVSPLLSLPTAAAGRLATSKKLIDRALNRIASETRSLTRA